MDLVVETSNPSGTPVFSPAQTTLIQVAAGFALLVAIWSVFRGLRPLMRGDQVRCAPFGFALLNLVFAFVGYLVTCELPLVQRHPLILPTSAVAGILAWGVAHSIDRTRFGDPAITGNKIT